jgi:hypothetical protein
MDEAYETKNEIKLMNALEETESDGRRSRCEPTKSKHKGDNGEQVKHVTY